MKNIIKTKYGWVSGIQKDGYILYKGIPFAKAPIGELRWKAPQPPEAWEGIYEADHFPPKAIQKNQKEGFYGKEFYSAEEFDVPISEDCLYLNIWVPEHDPKEKLPTAVWIHGGAFMAGYGSEPEFDGEAYVRQGIIFITVQYRLGIFGFLALEELRKEDEHGSTGNYGILDQIAALKWTYDNIDAFGGDPENITIMGQSAGAMSVQTLVSSQLTEPYISKAVMQSGGSYRKGLHSDKTVERACEFGKHVVDKLSGNAEKMTLEELRKLSAEQISNASAVVLEENIAKGKMELPYCPVIDGYVLKERYYETVEQGHLRKIEYLIGSNRNDIMITQEMEEKGEKVILYDGVKLLGDKLQELQKQKTYLYYFTRQLPGDKQGAFHSAELWYMFGTLERCWRPMNESDYKLSRRMVQYWGNFIKTGNPNSQELPQWKPYTGDEEEILILDADV